MPASSQQLSKYNNNKIFIETGALIGDGIQKALDAGYEKVISIECHQGYYEKSSDRFKGNDKVEVIYGDSSKDLFDIIEDINEPITFWLDAHYMWNDPNQDINNHPGNGYVPTYDELVQIKKHNLKNHTILIDDIDHLNNLSPRGSDPPTGTEDTLTSNLTKFVSTINDQYKFDTIQNTDGNFFECNL